MVVGNNDIPVGPQDHAAWTYCFCPDRPLRQTVEQHPLTYWAQVHRQIVLQPARSPVSLLEDQIQTIVWGRFVLTVGVVRRDVPVPFSGGNRIKANNCESLLWKWRRRRHRGSELDRSRNQKPHWHTSAKPESSISEKLGSITVDLGSPSTRRQILIKYNAKNKSMKSPTTGIMPMTDDQPARKPQQHSNLRSWSVQDKIDRNLNSTPIFSLFSGFFDHVHLVRLGLHVFSFSFLASR